MRGEHNDVLDRLRVCIHLRSYEAAYELVSRHENAAFWRDVPGEDNELMAWVARLAPRYSSAKSAAQFHQISYKRFSVGDGTFLALVKARRDGERRKRQGYR